MFLRGRSEKTEILKKVPLFSDLSPKHLDMIAQQADEVSMKAGTVMAQQGKFGQEFILLLDGSARVEKDGKTIAKLSTGDYFGEISLIDGGPRTATVIAETDVNLLVLHIQAFNHLLSTVPEISRSMLISLCKYLRRAEQSYTY